jgi:catechol 2,3-dioxygenase-like lactoylglutathione lyase family enzyme
VIRTYGLTHVALVVRSAERAFEFYRQVLGVVAVYRQDGMIQAQTPDTRDVLVFQEGELPVAPGGVTHFGFRLVDPEDIDAAVDAVRQAGGTVLRHGEFCPGEPYVFFHDLDGYEVEIWHEIPTPVDPQVDTRGDDA